jgi:hypothetical protein
VESHLPACDHASTAPLYYLDIQPLVVSQLPVVVDRIRHVNETLQLALTQAGELHLHTDTQSTALGCACGPPPPCHALRRHQLARAATIKVANRDVRDFRVGDELTRAVSRRPPISLDTVVARTEGYTYAAKIWDFSIVQGPFSVAPCQTVALRFATFCFALPRYHGLSLSLPTPCPTLNGHTVRSFPTHGQQSAAKGSSTTASRSDIRLIQYLDSSAHGLVRRWHLTGYFLIHLLPYTPNGVRPPYTPQTHHPLTRRRTTHATHTALQLHRGSPLQVHTCSSLQVRAR